MFRFVNGESKTVFGAAAIVGVLSFVSRMVGLVRDRILAGEFGAGDVLDAYYAAFKVPDFLFSLIVVGAISASFIPLFTKYYSSALSRPNAWRLTNNIVNLLGIAMIVLSAILAFFAEPLAQVIAPGFEGEKRMLVVEFTRIMLLAQVILAFSMVYGSVLQGMKRFAIYSAAPVLYNIGIIIGAIWLVDWLGVVGLAWGVVLGALMHLLVQVYGVVNTGYRYQFILRPFDRDTTEIVRLMVPRTLGIAVSQILLVVFTVIASTMAAGSVTIFQFAYNIQFFAVGIVGVSYAIAAFPSFSEQIERRNTAGFITVFSATVRQVLFFMIPLMLIFLVLRAQIVRVVVGAGEFDWTATILAADTLAFFALSFVFQAIVFVVVRAFFALHDTVTPLVAGVVSVAFGLVVALWLSPSFGVIALGIAYSVSSIVNLALLWVPLRQRIGNLDEEKIIRSLFIMSTAGMLSGLVIQLVKPLAVSMISLDTFWGVLSQGLLAGGAGIIVYGGICFALRSEEMRDVISGVRKRVFRKYQPEEAIATETQSGS